MKVAMLRKAPKGSAGQYKGVTHFKSQYRQAGRQTDRQTGRQADRQ